jgi:hypothetical protein
MQVAQRSTSVASITTTGYYTVDRFQTLLTTLGTWTQSQSTDVPTGQGFANSLKLDCTTADASPAAGDLLVLSQGFEGQNLQYLKKGTANALPLTASFWVKSTKTGTFILELFDANNTRNISKSYTVNVSNTWEFKTITFAGDTTGVFTNTNGGNLYINFWLGAGTTYTSGTLQTSWGATVNANTAVGQVNIADSTSNDFLITGVQLEAGEQASGFEFMPIDTNLDRCRRYYAKIISDADYTAIGSGFNGSTTLTATYVKYPVAMRASPTATQSNLAVIHNTFTITAVTGASGGFLGKDSAYINFNVASGLTVGQAHVVSGNNNASAYVDFSIEL